MKVLITGSESQIGKSLNNYIKKNRSNFFFFNRKDLDINKKYYIEKKIKEIKPDVIINCAAYTNVISAESNYLDANLVNNKSLLNLSNAANYFNTLLIHFSTDYVFDGKNKIKYKENDQTFPISVYGKTKLDGEKLIREKCNNFIILRVSWLFSNLKNNFVSFVIQRLLNNENIYAVNDLYSIPTSADQISNFLLFILNKTPLNNHQQLYHFVNAGKIVSWYEFALYIKRIFLNYENSNSKIIPISSNKFFKNQIRPKFSALDNKKIINNFNYKIEDWQTSINVLIKEYFKS